MNLKPEELVKALRCCNTEEFGCKDCALHREFPSGICGCGGEPCDIAADQIEAQGHIVLNPATLPEGMEPKDYMRICFAMIDVADEVWLLPRWAASEGAAIEWRYCRYICKDYRLLSQMRWFRPWKKEE